MTCEFIEELESKIPKSEADKMALAVAKVLVPVLTTAIGRSVEPAVAKTVKVGAGICKKTPTIWISCSSTDGGKI